MISAELMQAQEFIIKAVPLCGEHPTEREYTLALDIVEELLMTDPASPLLDILCARITAYESTIPELVALRKKIDAKPIGVALLRILMDQHNLKTSDFLEEIGSKSMVSRILNGHRQLSLTHINKLAARFGIPASDFV